jgi:hypothetical protein
VVIMMVLITPDARTGVRESSLATADANASVESRERTIRSANLLWK